MSEGSEKPDGSDTTWVSTSIFVVLLCLNFVLLALLPRQGLKLLLIPYVSHIIFGWLGARRSRPVFALVGAVLLSVTIVLAAFARDPHSFLSPSYDAMDALHIFFFYLIPLLATGAPIGWYVGRLICPPIAGPEPELHLFLCNKCGYNLQGNTSGKCPECGETISAWQMERVGRVSDR